MFGVIHQLLLLISDILKIRRSATIDSSREHAFWVAGKRLFRRLWKVDGPNKRAGSPKMQRYRTNKVSVGSWHSQAFVTELCSLGRPLGSALSILIKITLATAVYLLQIVTVKVNLEKALPLVAKVLIRTFFLVILAMLYNGIEGNYDGLQQGETFDTKPGRAFTFILFLLGWWDVMTSIAESLLRILPPTYAIVGWYYELYRAELLRSFRTDERPVKKLVVSSCFWVVVFALKLVFAYIQLNGITASVYKLSQFTDTSLAGKIATLVTLMLRGSFSILFFVADLQVFFAGVIGAFGGVTAAVTSLFGQLGSLWDRRDISTDQLHGVARGLMQTFPLAVSMHYEGLKAALSPDIQENDLLARLWNDGLLRDLYESHLVSDELAALLRFGRDTSGAMLLPDLSAVLPRLRVVARRRIHAFCSFAKRTVGVPVGSMPIHMPALTVLVPVYGETVIRSWHQMLDPRAARMTNLEHMIESDFTGFMNLFTSLAPCERAILDAHILKDAESGTPFGVHSVMRLRDRLWFSDHLLMVAKFGGDAGASTDRGTLHVSQAILQGSVLRCGTRTLHPSAPVGCEQDVLEELSARVQAARDAAALNLPCIDSVVEALYAGDGALSWVDLEQQITTERPEASASERERALEALGCRKDTAWTLQHATPLFREIHRTLLEARVKLAIRLWFSVREQTVWRTLSGLGKAPRALELLQDIANKALQGAAYHEGIGVQAAPRVPRSVFQVMAALQNYAGWTLGRDRLVRTCTSILLDLQGSDNDDALSAAKLARFSEELCGSNKLLALHDQCTATALLLNRYPSTQIALLQSVTGGRWRSTLCCGQPENGSTSPVGPAQPIADPCGQVAHLYTLRELDLPGNPIADSLAEGKPANQANALLHVGCELLMVNDCNQGADLEQWFFLPRLVNEFYTDLTGRAVLGKGVRIVGFRENIFTENGGIVGRSGALNEHVFGTIIQRQLQKTLDARLHYGHPDIFDFGFVLTQGGTSKMSKSVNVSEDIFGGINVFRRGGKIQYGDYFQIDKGRDVQYDAALDFEGKISCGTSMHAQSGRKIRNGGWGREITFPPLRVCAVAPPACREITRAHQTGERE